MPRHRSLALAAALLIAAVSPSSAGANVPSCGGQPATIVGTTLADRLTGTAGDDVVQGMGSDDLIVASGGSDLICGGSGTDVVSYATLGGGIELTSLNRTLKHSGEDILEAVEGVRGTRFHDVMTSGMAPYGTLWGGPGRDTLTSCCAGATMYGGRGDDRITSGMYGSSYLFGGPGDDIVGYGSFSPGVVDGGPGDDLIGGGGRGMGWVTYAGAPGPMVIDLGGESAVGYGHDRLYGVSGVVGSRFDDVIVASEFFVWGTGYVTSTLIGGPGDDELWGRSGRDHLFGAEGDDLLVGRSADDELHGGPGDDELDGGPDDDILRGGDGLDACVSGETVESCEGP